jgi:hypothetical protein
VSQVQRREALHQNDIDKEVTDLDQARVEMGMQKRKWYAL